MNKRVEDSILVILLAVLAVIVGYLLHNGYQLVKLLYFQ